MPKLVTVDRNTFNALTLSQAAISYARAALLYGSANQYKDLLSKRDGGSSGAQSLPRLTACRDGVKNLLLKTHGPLPTYFGSTVADRSNMYACALSAGVALYYRAGNCGEHADLTFNFLATFGFPGIEIIYASSTVMDHAYTVITWDKCADPIVCDAWPSTPQACLWSQFFANPHRTKPDPGFKVLRRHKITDANMGSDLIGDAFRLVNPTHVESLSPASRISGYTTKAITDYLTTKPKGLYNQLSTLDKTHQPCVDYVYQGQKLSETAPVGQQWTAKVEPIIVEANKRLKLLDPDMRYTRSSPLPA